MPHLEIILGMLKSQTAAVPLLPGFRLLLNLLPDNQSLLAESLELDLRAECSYESSMHDAVHWCEDIMV